MPSQRQNNKTVYTLLGCVFISSYDSPLRSQWWSSSSLDISATCGCNQDRRRLFVLCSQTIVKVKTGFYAPTYFSDSIEPGKWRRRREGIEAVNALLLTVYGTRFSSSPEQTLTLNSLIELNSGRVKSVTRCNFQFRFSTVNATNRSSG